MASVFTELCVDCSDPHGLARFWAQVLDYEVTDEDENLSYIAARDETPPWIVFVKVPESKKVKNRLHIDVSPRDREQQEEVERILALGARHADVGQGPDVSWVVLADPEDNEFCVLRTRKP